MSTNPTPRERALACAPKCATCRGTGTSFKSQPCRSCKGTGRIGVDSIERMILEIEDEHDLFIIDLTADLKSCIDKATRRAQRFRS